MKQEYLYEKASSLPTTPGVYIWLDSSGQTIYIGKAKNLRSRVLSYFRDYGDGRLQLPRLMSKAAELDYIVTGSEIEALITEANLVRARKPRYNVRLKDDKRYPYIKITKEEVPRIFVTRKIVDDGSRYLGPYTDAKAVRKTVELVHSLFPIRFCRDKLPSTKRDRACINYQIKKCSGPCVGNISVEEYNRYVEDAYRFIIGKNSDLIRSLRKRMQEASDNLEFERASVCRDMVNSLEKINARRKALSTERLTGDWDVVNYHIIDNEACVVIMEIREGNILGKKDYIMSGVKYSSSPEMLSEFLAQYYLQASMLPPEIHLPLETDDAEVITELFEKRRNGPFSLIYPKRGEKARLLAMAALNAETILVRNLEKRDRLKNTFPRVIHSLQRDLHLTNPPRKIACIDISHLHGSDTVGSLIYFCDGKPEKKEYRHFKVTSVEGIDDFASMREVVRRYFTRRIEEKQALPDLLLVDGGKGQLSSAITVLNELGLEKQATAGLAKRLEEVFLPGASEAQNIPKTSSSIHLLQRIRDEAHRFAITYQRKLRTKRSISSAISGIKGVGDMRTRTLLQHFGSVKALRNASVEEIAQINGIGPKLACIIHKGLTSQE